MKINEVDPRNFDSDIDYYNALNAKPKARTPSEPRISPAQQAADDEDAISQKRQAAHAQFQKGRTVKYVDEEGSAPNGQKYNKLYVIHAKDAITAQHEEYMFDKHEWGAKKVVDTKREENDDGTVTTTLYIVDNHKYGMWKPWKEVEEARRANTASARAELSKRERKVDPVQQDKKKKESDEAWERLQQYMANKDKEVEEGLNEFAPPGSNDGDDGFSEETLKRLAAQWYNGDEDPRVERTLMAAGWEIGQDEGYDDEPGVFVVQAGDANGNSYISWPAHELKQSVAEGTQTVGYEILGMLRQVKRQGHDAMEELYSSCPLLAQYWDQYEGDFRSMVIELSPKTLNRIKAEISAFNQQGVAEATDNPTDVICVDVPLFIRLMEYAREDASSDMDLHDVAERLTKLSASGETVSMSSYDEIVGSQKEIKEADMDLEQGRKNILSILKAAEQGQDAEIMVGDEPITLEYPEARFVGGRYKSFMKAGRQEEFLRALTNPRAFDRIMAKMRATLDKQKNFRGSVPGERGVEEDAPAVAKMAGGLGLGLVAAAGAPAIVGILGPLLGIPFAAYGAYSAAKLGMKGVEKLWDMAAEKLGGDDKVEQYTKSKIAALPPEEAKAAAAVVNKISESRKLTAPKLEEGVVDAVKAGAKKAFKALTGPDDEELLQRLEKETGGKRPEKKDNEKVKESAPPGFDQDLEKKLLKQYKDNPERAYATMWTIHNKQKNESFDKALVNASAKLKENEYFCMLDKQVKLIPEGYKRNSQGFLVRK